MKMREDANGVYQVLPSEVSSVHAVVKDIDSSDLTQTQVAESHHQTVSENVRIRISFTGQTCFTYKENPVSNGCQ